MPWPGASRRWFGPTLNADLSVYCTWSKVRPGAVRRRGRAYRQGSVGDARLMALASFLPFIYWLFTTVLNSPTTIQPAGSGCDSLVHSMPILHATSFMLQAG